MFFTASQITLPQGDTRSFDFPSYYTVDQCKHALFRSEPSLSAERPEDYRLGKTQEDLLAVEFKRMTTCIPELEQYIADEIPYALVLVRNVDNKTIVYSRQGNESFDEAQKRLSRAVGAPGSPASLLSRRPSEAVQRKLRELRVTKARVPNGGPESGSSEGSGSVPISELFSTSRGSSDSHSPLSPHEGSAGSAQGPGSTFMESSASPADAAPVEAPAPPADAAPVEAPAPPADVAPVEPPAPPAALASAEPPAPPADAAPVEPPAPPAALASAEPPAPPADVAPVEAPAPPAALASAEPSAPPAALASAEPPAPPADVAPVAPPADARETPPVDAAAPPARFAKPPPPPTDAAAPPARIAKPLPPPADHAAAPPEAPQSDTDDGSLAQGGELHRANLRPALGGGDLGVPSSGGGLLAVPGGKDQDTGRGRMSLALRTPASRRPAPPSPPRTPPEAAANVERRPSRAPPGRGPPEARAVERRPPPPPPPSAPAAEARIDAQLPGKEIGSGSASELVAQPDAEVVGKEAVNATLEEPTVVAPAPAPLASEDEPATPGSVTDSPSITGSEPFGESIVVKFFLPGGSGTTTKVPRSASLREVKEIVVRRAHERSNVLGGTASDLVIADPKTKKVFDDPTLLLQDLPPIKHVLENGSIAQLQVQYRDAARRDEFVTQVQTLAGEKVPFTPETRHFHSHIGEILDKERESLAASEAHERDEYPIFLSEAPLPSGLPPKIQIRVAISTRNVKKGLMVDPTISADELCDIAVSKAKHFLDADRGQNAELYVLKVSGLREYIHGKHELQSFDYIRRCLAMKRTADVSLCPRRRLTRSILDEDEMEHHLTKAASADTIDPAVLEEALFGSSNSAGSSAGTPGAQSGSFTLSASLDSEGAAPWRDLSGSLCVGTTEPAERLVHAAAIPLACISQPFRFRVIGADNVPDPVAYTQGKEARKATWHLFVEGTLVFGGQAITSTSFTNVVNASSYPRWQQWLQMALPAAERSMHIQTSDLPLESRLCLTLVARPVGSSGEKDVPLGWVNMLLFDFQRALRMGRITLRMWSDSAAGEGNRANFIGTCVQNVRSPNPILLCLELDAYARPVVAPAPGEGPSAAERASQRADSITQHRASIAVGPQGLGADGVGAADELGKPSDNDATKLQALEDSDPLHPLTAEDKQLLNKYSRFCSDRPRLLPKYLRAVKWESRQRVVEAHKMLQDWHPPDPIDALELLDADFSDSFTRKYAVDRISVLSDSDIQSYMLQLTQVLKYEPYHMSALAQFLLIRALNNPHIGHIFFWCLKAEMHVPEIRERYGVLLQAYVTRCGSYRRQLYMQKRALESLAEVATLVQNTPKDERTETMRKHLAAIEWPERLQLPLNPRMEVSGLRTDKCKWMDSKKVPLWLVFENADPEGAPITVMFKSGDDLRQDNLTLQMIGLMHKLWQVEGLDLRLTPYGCVATGDEEGMLEIVLNSDTIANIQKRAGGMMGAFREEPIYEWLQQNKPPGMDMKEVVDNFIHSCAGYCVATYVLGIGDRHNDNIMVNKNGRFFHIDFGHFLGNIKRKFGIKRERAPFVLTPDMAYAMCEGNRSPDNANFVKFVDLCCKAYLILRKNAHLFTSLFCMMLSTGMPELQRKDDVSYLSEAFSVEMSDEEAMKKFKDLIKESLNSTATKLVRWSTPSAASQRSAGAARGGASSSAD